VPAVNLDGILIWEWHKFRLRIEETRTVSEDGFPEREYARAIGLVVLTTGLCFLLRPYLQTTDVAMLFLLAVVAVASWYRLGAALLASVLSIAAFDWVFVPPYYTFNVHNAAYFLTFVVMLAVAVLMSRLTARLRDQADEAREREERTAALYAIDRDLAGAQGYDQQLEVASRHLGQLASGKAVLLLVDQALVGSAGPGWPTDGVLDGIDVRVAARWAYDHGESAGMGTAHGSEAEALLVPLRTPTRKLGVAVLRPDSPEDVIGPIARRTAEALVDRTAAALDGTLWAEQHEQARLEVEAERLRTAILSSLSHDLRTPLGSIEGAASSLLHDQEALPVEVRRDLAETILEESRRMTRLVANLLDMVRVETGGLAVRKEWQPLEEALGVALVRLEDRLATHAVEACLPNDLPLVPIDELLLEQVFINLLENAVKHTPPGTRVTVSARVDGGTVVVEVADSGPGVPAGAEEAIFLKFYRAPAADHSSGAGLGLTICRGIIVAHGGRIWVEPRPGGGAAFRFTLPLDGPPIASFPAELSER
jgi:two-component system sensor histidine kinase KdpD